MAAKDVRWDIIPLLYCCSSNTSQRKGTSTFVTGKERQVFLTMQQGKEELEKKVHDKGRTSLFALLHLKPSDTKALLQMMLFYFVHQFLKRKLCCN